MLQITIPGLELWNEKTEEFEQLDSKTICLEHSLISISKWESKWNIPFLSSNEKTVEQTEDYIRCMTITPNVDEIVYSRLTKENYIQINEYIKAPMTATIINESSEKGKQNARIITSELIYYWMIALGIPTEFQKWHINRLLTLIRVCNVESQPAKKMSKSETMKMNTELNAARLRKLGTRG